jgi:hypothetical protein
MVSLNFLQKKKEKKVINNNNDVVVGKLSKKLWDNQSI